MITVVLLLTISSLGLSDFFLDNIVIFFNFQIIIEVKWMTVKKNFNWSFKSEYQRRNGGKTATVGMDTVRTEL